MSAGVMPGMREAWPSVRGRTSASFSFASLESEPDRRVVDRVRDRFLLHLRRLRDTALLPLDIAAVLDRQLDLLGHIRRHF